MQGRESCGIRDLCKVIKDILGDKDENDRLSSARMKMIVSTFQKLKKKRSETDSQETRRRFSRSLNLRHIRKPFCFMDLKIPMYPVSDYEIKSLSSELYMFFLPFQSLTLIISFSHLNIFLIMTKRGRT